jgi:hypothetical protein
MTWRSLGDSNPCFRRERATRPRLATVGLGSDLNCASQNLPMICPVLLAGQKYKANCLTCWRARTDSNRRPSDSKSDARAVNRLPIFAPRIASSANVTLVAQSALTIRCEPIEPTDFQRLTLVDVI